MLKKIKLGFLGLGTVACGAISVLRNNAKEIQRRCRAVFAVHKVAARRLRIERPINLDGLRLTNDAEAVVVDSEVDIVVELMGGCEPARELILKAIAAGKHVVTANKELLAIHGEEIFAAANKRKTLVAFEAAVGGGIPIIKILRESFAANQIEWIAGIVNGTNNYILSEMYQAKTGFSDALASAQKLGYAEANPELDINGTDAAHKLTIMASLAFGVPLNFSKVFISGISDIHSVDNAYAEKFGYRIKHLAIAKRNGKGLELRVHPALVPATSLIAKIEGVMNAVAVHGDAAKTLLFCGAGAGAEATGSAVVADIIEVVRNMNSDCENRVPTMAFQADARKSIHFVDISESQAAFYLRLLVRDNPGVLANVAGVLGSAGISIEAVLQKPSRRHDNEGIELVILTHRIDEGRLRSALQIINKLEDALARTVSVRIEDKLD